MVEKARKFLLRTDRIEMTREEVEAKWNGEDGIERTYPEGQDNIDGVVARNMMAVCRGYVCEIGCGTGRIGKLFAPDKYVGVDINSEAVKTAKANYPRHDFRVIKWDDPYPKAETYLFYTMLLHVPDDEINGIAKRLSGRVVVMEAMMRFMRLYGLSNNFQRYPDEYREVFRRHGFKEKALTFIKMTHFPYFINMVVYDAA